MKKMLMLVIAGVLTLPGCGDIEKHKQKLKSEESRSLERLQGCRITLEKDAGGRLTIAVNGTSSHSMTEHKLEDIGTNFFAQDHEVFELADYSVGGAMGNAIMQFRASAELLNPSIKYVEIKGSDKTATLAVPEQSGTVGWP